jgi:hypothetical protein
MSGSSIGKGRNNKQATAQEEPFSRARDKREKRLKALVPETSSALSPHFPLSF